MNVRLLFFLSSFLPFFLSFFLLSSVQFSTGFFFFAAGFNFKNRTGGKETKVVVPMNFFKKFFELQILMLQHNAGLTADHPYASQPIDWPFDLSGISFWTDNVDNQQVYAIGNLAGWWICVLGLSVFVGVVGADGLARRRGIEPIEDRQSSSLSLFFIYLKNRFLTNSSSFLFCLMRKTFATGCTTTLAFSSSAGCSTTCLSTSCPANCSSTTTCPPTSPRLVSPVRSSTLS